MADHGPSGRLIPNLYGEKYYFYLEPNPALTEALVGRELQGIVADWTAKVAATYIGKLESRKSHKNQKKDVEAEEVENLASTVRAETYIGGFKNDRHIGEITVGSDTVVYAAADEFGRHTPAEGQRGSTTQGSHDLRDSLYEHLPEI